jgi:hypothetical protein
LQKPSPPERFLVVAAGKVVLDSNSVEVCKDYLMNNFGRGASNPQRMVCEVIDDKVKDDPHTCGGQNQGGGGMQDSISTGGAGKKFAK